ncbi:MAG: MarR family winged helix-turn-helix transcriptional regulator [Acidimicrobiales bacterium]
MAESAQSSRWLDPAEDRAWRGWLAMEQLLRTQLARDLQAECGLSESDYMVLVHLSERADGKMRMSELASRLQWSRSRLSHHIARMHGRGLVAREGCPSDARGWFAVITDVGRAEIVGAAPRHVASVRRHFIDVLDAEQLASLAEITNAVVARLLKADS